MMPRLIERRLLAWIGLMGVSVASVFPIFWMALTAIRPADEVFSRTFRLWPEHVAWHNFPFTWITYPVGDWLFNSLVVAVLGGLLSVLLDLLAAYAFAKLIFRGRNALFLLFLAALMLPTQVYMVPQFMTVAALGGVNQLWAVIVPKAAETYGIFLARQFLAAMPDELLDAARLDGASEWHIFWRIVLPLNKPVIAILSLLLTLGYWNDFAWPLVILKSESSLTLPVGISFLQGEHITDWPGLMIITLISLVPILLLFGFLQRYFIQGISRSGIK